MKLVERLRAHEGIGAALSNDPRFVSKLMDEAADKLAAVQKAIDKFELALKNREHGDVAAWKCVESVQAAMKETTKTPDDLVEEMAKAIYNALPDFGWERRPNTAGGYDQVCINDTWEEATHRHEDCRRQARAALIVVESK